MVAFDEQLHPVSVNLGLLDHCYPDATAFYASKCSPPCPAPPMPYCPAGPAIFQGTDFEDSIGAGGATGWLQTVVPVEPSGDLRMRFAIWDTGDAALDSTVLIDRLRWSATPATVTTTPSPL
ncbi:MAG: hypothetical protein KC731_03930 [Myxococcales bacterium]|nr:hypothetical protein [Myxococcales bacterium]